MEKRKALLPILIGILAVALAAVLLLPEQDAPPSAQPAETKPSVQDDSVAVQPTGTLPAQTTAPAATTPSEPDQTDPVYTEPRETLPEDPEPRPTEPAAEAEPLFPVQLEDGMLTVGSMLQFNGMNPDADNAFGEEIAGIEMTNSSDRHMTFAEVTAILADGTVLTFRAEDVPPGRTVMAFSLEHGTVKDLRDCAEVYGYAEFEEGDPLRSDLVMCTVNGIEITVTNLTDGELTDLEVICHGLLDSSFFGGSTYRYNVSTLPAGASTVLYAGDCFLGMVEVVRVDRRG